MSRCERLLLCVCRVKTGLLCLPQVGLHSFIPSFPHSPCCVSSLLPLADDTFLFSTQPISRLPTPAQGAELPAAQRG